MPTEDETDNPRTVLEAVGVLARSERLLPALVEELLQPEFSDWARPLGTRPFTSESNPLSLCCFACPLTLTSLKESSDPDVEVAEQIGNG